MAGRVPHPNVVFFDVRVGFRCRMKYGISRKSRKEDCRPMGAGN